MFGLGKKAALRREIDLLELEQKAAGLRAPVSNETAISAPTTWSGADREAWAAFLRQGAGRGLSPDVAMTHSVVYACVSLIAGVAAMLPILSYRRDAKGNAREETASAQARLLGERPAPRYSRSVFWRKIVSDMLLRGNGVAWIERASFNSATPVWIWPVPFSRVRVEFGGSGGGRVYTLTLDDGRVIRAPEEDVLHFPGSVEFNGLVSASPIAAYARSVGIGIAADDFAKSYFDNGFSADSVITYPNGFKGGPEQRDEIRDYVKRKLGGDKRFSGPLVLDQGGTMEMLRISAADTQLLESRRHQAIDIARIFHVPPHLIGEQDKASSFGKGLEEMSRQFVNYTLGPHLTAIEEEVNYKLYGQRVSFCEFDREAFNQGDFKSLMESLQIAVGGAQGPGILTQNEARRRLREPLLDDPAADKPVQWTGPAEKSKPTPAQPA